MLRTISVPTADVAEWIKLQDADVVRTPRQHAAAYCEAHAIQLDKQGFRSLVTGLTRRLRPDGSHGGLTNVAPPIAARGKQTDWGNVDPIADTVSITFAPSRALVPLNHLIEKNGFALPETQRNLESSAAIFSNAPRNLAEAHVNMASSLIQEAMFERLQKEAEEKLRKSAERRADDLASRVEDLIADKRFAQELVLQSRSGGRNPGGNVTR